MQHYKENKTSFLFQLTVDYVANTTYDKALTGKTIVGENGTKTINGKEYHLYEGKSMTGEKIFYYVYQYDNDSYYMSFIFNKGKESEEFIEKFMNTVSYE
jgi:hypothetical protein